MGYSLESAEMDEEGINTAMAAEVAALTAEQRSARIEEIVHGGEMDFATSVEFAKLLFGANVSVFHHSGDND